MNWINYKFIYKDDKGIMGEAIITIPYKDNELAIATFEREFPLITWRAFLIIESNINKQ